METSKEFKAFENAFRKNYLKEEDVRKGCDSLSVAVWFLTTKKAKIIFCGDAGDIWVIKDAFAFSGRKEFAIVRTFEGSVVESTGDWKCIDKFMTGIYAAQRYLGLPK